MTIKIIETVDKLRSEYITMKISKVEDANGEIRFWEWFQRTGTTKAVAVIPLVYSEYESQSAKIVLVRQFRVPVGDYVFEFPAGLMDKENEDEIEVAKRELFEETGLSIKRVFHKTPQMYNSPGATDESISYIVAEVEGEPSTENCGVLEDISVEVMTVDDVKKLLSSDNKIDSKCYAWLNWFVLQFGLDSVIGWDRK